MHGNGKGNNNKGNGNANTNGGGKQDTDGRKQVGLERFTESSSITISDSVQCNAQTPPLNQPFLYGQQPIRGVNLGGWLVLEPFITPSLFEPYLVNNVTDEYSLTKFLGPQKAREYLEKHYKTWVTEETFRRIRDLGLNHVRIPIGFWALGDLATTEGGEKEPYVPDLALDYLLQGLKWAAKYGIRVMVELHAAPGSQNGWNHSGKAGKIHWLDGTPEGLKNGQRTIEYTKKMTRLLQGPGMEHVTPLYGILNEPAIFMLERTTTDKWYKEVFAAMRDITGTGTGAGAGAGAGAGKGPWAIIHDGFLGLKDWEGFMPNSDRLALDIHQYLIFDHNLIRLSRKDQANFPCDVWAEGMQRSSVRFGPTLVGEFSSATNDCARHLNGIGIGARWDGTFTNGDDPTGGVSAACDPKKNGHIPGFCSCEAQNNADAYTPDYRKFLSDFTQAQMDAFEQGFGWFYWNFKTETNALWSYFDGVDQG
ncbi:glycoside hydrolase superfamily [Lobosporangium transversale]|uniref:glucan 1,3-beta-glucosidase n=1 Tax=Lobosporangium transversale TaxID=64571 RepID=A0A1Y2GB34_9FUNG|nr:glycoside hydrolase superfamily [Lobosporangium transversale]ORZ04961.1 glycoside hydrolase superfamily [Lobosporangium transversale]|eukprot:XP_021876825.1 glycoside hydrolase superfamily [Lobosporangium transversale]